MSYGRTCGMATRRYTSSAPRTGALPGDPIQGSPMTRRFPANPAVAVSPANHVHVVWRYARCHRRQPDILEEVNGWRDDMGPDTRLSTGTPNSVSPAVAVWLNNVHVVWDDFRDGNDEIYYRRSLGRRDFLGGGH